MAREWFENGLSVIWEWLENGLRVIQEWLESDFRGRFENDSFDLRTIWEWLENDFKLIWERLESDSRMTWERLESDLKTTWEWFEMMSRDVLENVLDTGKILEFHIHDSVETLCSMQRFISFQNWKTGKLWYQLERMKLRNYFCALYMRLFCFWQFNFEFSFLYFKEILQFFFINFTLFKSWEFWFKYFWLVSEIGPNRNLGFLNFILPSLTKYRPHHHRTKR